MWYDVNKFRFMTQKDGLKITMKGSKAFLSETGGETNLKILDNCGRSSSLIRASLRNKC